MKTREQLLGALRQTIVELDPAAAHARQQAGALLVDVREAAETVVGTPLGALLLPRSALELSIEQQVPQRERELLLLCASGSRSLLAAGALRELGYANVASVAGGYGAWQRAGLPLAAASALSEAERQRYARQLILPELGAAGQLRLKAATVLVVGAGGLGSPVALYLAAAGVGRLRLVDGDRLEASNLHRQVLHRSTSLGEPKVHSARQQLLALNPLIEVEARHESLHAGNAAGLLAGVDLVVDGADNFATRFLLNDACLALRLPWVYGAVHRFEGQVSCFDPRQPQSPCYRCLFPAPPPPEAAPNCAEAGVLGAVPGTIGLLQANEALKLLLGFGRPLVGRLLCFDARAASFRELKLGRDPHCPGCSQAQAIQSLTTEAAACAAGADS